MNYTWDFSIIWAARVTLLKGLLVSCELTVFCIVVGTCLAIPVALILARKATLIYQTTNLLVEVIRALPILVLLIWFYYVMPNLMGVSLSAFWTAAWVLAINLAAFAADILRGGIVAIPTEHIEAAEALGMTRLTVIRRIIVPETFRRSFAALTAMYITMFKFSTLASVISVWELLHTADSIIIQTYKPLEVYTIVALIYLAVIVPATYGAKALERHPLFAVNPGNAR
jgi:polar amino acid transport system permease protein